MSKQKLKKIVKELKGASNYRLQIARPNFKAMEALELDTLISGTKFLHTLFPSDFDWRVRAKNSGYQTAYTTRALTVLVPTDITKQKVVLPSPAANAATKTRCRDSVTPEIHLPCQVPTASGFQLNHVRHR